MRSYESNTIANRLSDSAIHDWYRFVLAFPDHLVADYLDKFGIEPGQTVLDPFVGTGTTLVECKKRGIASVGVDANPVTAFASRVKSNWDIDLDEFCRRRDEMLRRIRTKLIDLAPADTPQQLTFEDVGVRERPAEYKANGDTSAEEITALIPKGAMSFLPLAKTLAVRRAIFDQPEDSIRDLFLLALAASVVGGISNLGFGPEVYVSRQRADADVYSIYSDRLYRMETDLRTVQDLRPFAEAEVFHHDARTLAECVSGPIDALITSPPYPNEKDYTRTTRLEMVLLGFIRDKKELRAVKERMLRSNTRNIFVKDEDGQLVKDVPDVVRVAKAVEQKRIERGADSGFEKLYHRVVLEYFGGMYRVFRELEKVMRRGAQAAIVVGDQMSYFRVPIKTAELLAAVVEKKGLKFRVVGIEEFRTRRATATKMDISETVLVLKRR
ncbi:MAG: DNA methyltransferase [Deltaproteobacteria bacterium]|nr:DNA methyltransferase [Deltaproteobacteria bacterium]